MYFWCFRPDQAEMTITKEQDMYINPLQAYMAIPLLPHTTRNIPNQKNMEEEVTALTWITTQPGSFLQEMNTRIDNP